MKKPREKSRTECRTNQIQDVNPDEHRTIPDSSGKHAGRTPDGRIPDEWGTLEGFPRRVRGAAGRPEQPFLLDPPERGADSLVEPLRFVVDGEPVAKERARTVRPKGSVVVRTFTPPATRSFEARVRLLCAVAANRTGWRWTASSRFAVTLRVFRTHRDKGGDLDNVAKAVLDGMNGAAFADDRHVHRLVASLEEPDPVRPRVEVEVRALEAA